MKIKTPVTDNGVIPSLTEEKPAIEDGDIGVTITEEDKIIKNEDGTFTNENGEIVDENGNVLNSNNDDDVTSDEDVSILIDDVEYQLDKDGNAITSNGDIFKTKSELEQLESDVEIDDNETVSIKDLNKLSGIVVEPKDGDESFYDFTLDNLAKRDKLIQEQALTTGRQTALEEFFSANPDIYKALMYKEQTGSLEGFSNTPYYKSITIDTANEEQMFNFIVEAEIKKGTNPKRAKSIATYFKENNELEEVGKESYEYLANLENKEFEEFENKKIQDQRNIIQSEIDYYGTYYNEKGEEIIVDKEGTIYDKIVNKGKFGNYVIPQNGIIINRDNKKMKLSRKDIFDYISKPVKDNMTQAQIDEQNRISNTDVVLQQYINNLTGNNLDVLIERKILESKSKHIKARLRTSNKPNSKPNKKLKLITPVK